MKRNWKYYTNDGLPGVTAFHVKGNSKKNFFSGIVPKPADPPIGTFRNKNLNFGQI